MMVYPKLFHETLLTNDLDSIIIHNVIEHQEIQHWSTNLVLEWARMAWDQNLEWGSSRTENSFYTRNIKYLEENIWLCKQSCAVWIVITGNYYLKA